MEKIDIPMRRPRPRKIDPAEAAKILATARAYVFKNGVSTLTIDGLARMLNTNVRKIYDHYSSKLLLVEAVFNAKLDEMDRDLTEALKGDQTNAGKRLRKVVDILKHHGREYSPALFQDIHDYSSALSEWYHEKRSKILRGHLEKVSSECQKAGVIDKSISFNVFFSIYMMLTDGTIIRKIATEDNQIGLSDFYEQISNLMLNGVLVPESNPPAKKTKKPQIG